MPKVKEPKVGVIILTENKDDDVKDCLKSLYKNRYGNTIIIVVKDARHRGYAKGNNSGIVSLLKQKCEYILLVNDDTVSHPDLIAKLVSSFRVDPSIGIAGPTITYFNKPETIWYSGGNFNRVFGFTTHPNMDRNVRYSSSGYTDFVSGCCMMIRRKVFEDIGLLDTRFGYYFEDVFFCNSASRNGYRSYFIKDALLMHKVSSTLGKTGTNSMTPRRAYYFARNPHIMIRDENIFLFKCTQLLGQILIRLPYYTGKILYTGELQSMVWYLRGLRDGLWYFLKGGVLKHEGEKIK